MWVPESELLLTSILCSLIIRVIVFMAGEGKIVKADSIR